MLTKDGDLGDGARYIFCAPLDDVLGEWGLNDVGVEGRELEPEGTFLVDGEVDRGEEVPTFFIVGGVKVDVVFAGALVLVILGDEHVFFVSVFNGAPGEGGFSDSFLFAAS